MHTLNRVCRLRRSDFSHNFTRQQSAPPLFLFRSHSLANPLIFSILQDFELSLFGLDSVESKNTWSESSACPARIILNHPNYGRKMKSVPGVFIVRKCRLIRAVDVEIRDDLRRRKLVPSHISDNDDDEDDGKIYLIHV